MMTKPESTEATRPPWRDPNVMATLNPTPTLSPAAQIRWDCLTLAAEVCEGESSEDIVKAAEDFARFVLDA